MDNKSKKELESYSGKNEGNGYMNNSFEALALNVEQIHTATSGTAKKAVNQLLTMRNWMIGYYIVEFEQNGEDRAEYGSHLLTRLAERIGIKGLEQIKGLPEIRIGQKNLENASTEICDSVNHKFQTDPDVLISALSFTHIREIMSIDDPFERFFYEFECIQGAWSVRELRRQIGSNLYVRAGISKKPEILLEKIKRHEYTAELTIKEPITLEFLGLEAKEAVTESELEQALIDHLQEFMLELGKGFCFEARHKRILIDDEYYFPDLVFYNRILHCSVIFELKNEPFSHENLGQLNAYVGYYKENEMNPGDNPPVGVLLCTKKGKKMVEYALSGMDNQLFVSTYMLQLPDKKQLEEFLLKQMEDMGL